jgi:hypothetical protein
MERLGRRINIASNAEMPLRDVLNLLHDKVGANFRINDQAFKALEPPLENVEDIKIRLPRMLNTRLDSFLTLALNSVNGTVLVRRDHLEITTLKEACRECGGPWPGFDVDLDWIDDPTLMLDFRLPFVQMSFSNRPLSSLFAELMCQYSDQNIVFAPQSAQRLKVPVTGRLLNVPFNQALRMLAKLADLEAVTCGNITLITTAEKAEPMLKDLSERRAIRRIQHLLASNEIYATPAEVRAAFFPQTPNPRAPMGGRAKISWDDYARNVLDKLSEVPEP